MEQQNRYAFLKSDIELSTDDKLSKAQRNLLLRPKCRDSYISECKQTSMRSRYDVKHGITKPVSTTDKNIGQDPYTQLPVTGQSCVEPVNIDVNTQMEQLKLQQDIEKIDSETKLCCDSPTNIVKQENGSDLILKNYWTVWIHKNSSTDWSLKSYNKVMLIKSIADFWKFINNFNKLMYTDYQFFIMRNDITPTWEDPSNKFGGAASIKLSVTDSCLLTIWERICLQMICEKLYFGTSPSIDVNGASFNLKDTTTVIKIWNNDNRNDIVKKLSIVGVNSMPEPGNFRTVGRPRGDPVINPKYKIIYIKNRPDH